MSYKEDYNEQPVFEIDCLYSEESDSSELVQKQPVDRRSLHWRPHKGALDADGAGAYSPRKGLAPQRGQYRQPCAGVPSSYPFGTYHMGRALYQKIVQVTKQKNQFSSRISVVYHSICSRMITD